ncbi:MAG: ribonuclease III [Defluviitaleaceae bacterium]|nr:ribonuclease III [Defluviitaleaceae bacterium]
METVNELLNTLSKDNTPHAGSAGNYSPLTLAYIGDAVFELLVRTHVLSENGNMQAAKLHKKSAAIVCAKAQSEAYFKLLEHLTEDELNTLKRGRNARPHSMAKKTSVAEYLHATGVETLFGYLFLAGETARLKELFQIVISE